MLLVQENQVAIKVLAAQKGANNEDTRDMFFGKVCRELLIFLQEIVTTPQKAESL